VNDPAATNSSVRFDGRKMDAVGRWWNDDDDDEVEEEVDGGTQ
jgi:hypothetical protein